MGLAQRRADRLTAQQVRDPCTRHARLSSAIIRSPTFPSTELSCLWHHHRVIALAHIVFQFLADLLGLVALSFRLRRSVKAENLFLRRQLALYKERGIKPRRIDTTTRMSLVFLSKLFDWRDALVVVRVLRNNSVRSELTDLGMAVASSGRDRGCPYSLPVVGGPPPFDYVIGQTGTLAGGRESLPAPSAGAL